ncbi:MAG: isochorismate synthase [Prevotellaceae bacterium]|nr:isochorismate synthase [Candidatus Minthosoma caballi]
MIDLSLYSSYALYRLPFADEVNVVCQQSAMEQDCGRAFVMIPFDESKYKTIRIRPDYETTIKYGHESKAVSSHSDLISDKIAYKEAFNRYISNIPTPFAKLVLSRSAEMEYSGNPIDAFFRACKEYPRVMVYLTYTKESGFWIGCTPEILVSGSKSHFRTVALAGTMNYEGEWSQKNREEQAIVANYIREIITPISTVVEEEGPYTSRAGNLFHLKTEFHFSPISSAKVTDFIAKLNPTPAVCGLPATEAKQFILANENCDRSYYSGVVGMLDAQGETNLYVNLRCANIRQGKATLYAGGGILAESTLESEWAETEQKMNTILQIL